MTQRIDALRTIVRLRERDVAKCERAMEEARARARTAETHAHAAEEALALAMAAEERALNDQRGAPANPHVQLHCRTCHARCEMRREIREQTGLILTEARAQVEARSQEWRRAQMRHEVLAAELQRAFRQMRRQIALRMEDEIGHRAPRPLLSA